MADAPAAVVPAAPPAAPASPPVGTPQPPVTTRTVKQMPTRSKASPIVSTPRGASPPAATPPAPATPQSAAPAPATPASAPGSEVNSTEPPKQDGAVAADSAAATPPDPAVKPAEPPKLDDKELSSRLARLTRAEGKLAEERRAFAQERQQHATALQQLQGLQNARTDAHKDPIGWLQRTFGIEPRLVIDRLVAEQTKKPEQRLQEQVQSQAEKIAAFEKAQQESVQRQQQERETAQIRDYISSTIAPMITKDTCPHLTFKAGGAGQAAALVYDTMNARYKSTGTAPEPRAVVEFLERTFRQQAEKAGLARPSVPPGEQANRTKPATATASTQVATRQPPAATAPRVRQKIVARPYTTKPV